MGVLMDLIAGNTREILLAISVDDWQGLRDETRFPAHLSLGGGLDPIWLDLFSESARDVTGRTEPDDFSAACYALEGPGDIGDRTVERVDRGWLESVAILPHDALDRLAGRWIELVNREERDVDPDDKPMLRSLAEAIVDFARRSETAEDVLFAWSF